MLQSVIVYGLFALSLWWLGKIAAKRERIYFFSKGQNPPFWTWEIVASLLIFAIISGIRWQVGVDHLNYLQNFYEIGSNNYLTHENFRGRGIEPGYFYVTKLFAYLGIHYTVYFAFWAFLQLFFIYYAVKNERYLLPFIGLVIIFGGHYLSWMNGIRQMISACIFVYSIKYIKDRKLIPYIITILIATTFHRSAIILLFFYFIPQIDYFKKRYINVAILLGTVFIGLNPTWLQAIEYLEVGLSLLGYEHYASRVDVLIESSREMNIGPRRISVLLSYGFLIWFAPVLKNEYKSTGFVIYFNFTMIGMILYNLFINTSHIFLRPVNYFTIFSILSISYLLYYLKPQKDYKVTMKFMIVLIVSLSYLVFAIFSAGISTETDFTNYKFYFMND